MRTPQNLYMVLVLQLAAWATSLLHNFHYKRKHGCLLTQHLFIKVHPRLQLYPLADRWCLHILLAETVSVLTSRQGLSSPCSALPSNHKASFIIFSEELKCITFPLLTTLSPSETAPQGPISQMASLFLQPWLRFQLSLMFLHLLSQHTMFCIM